MRKKKKKKKKTLAISNQHKNNRKKKQKRLGNLQPEWLAQTDKHHRLGLVGTKLQIKKSK